MGLNVSSGTWNYRANRNSPSKLSLHSWGIAIDLFVGENPNKGSSAKGGSYANTKTNPPATFSTAPYKKFVDILEKHGLYSIGRWGDYYWMHFQTWPYKDKE